VSKSKGSDSNIRGVGVDRVDSRVGVNASNSVDRVDSRVGVQSGNGVDRVDSRVGVDRVDGRVGADRESRNNNSRVSFGFSLGNMLNSVVLGNVVGSNSEVLDSSVVLGVLVAGNTVASRDSGSVSSNRADSRVGVHSSNSVDWVDSRVAGDRSNSVDRVDSRVSVHSSNSVDRVDSGVASDRESREDNSGVSLSLSLTLENSVDKRCAESAVWSECSHQR